MEPTERFDKFTERARKVLSLAHEEAARFNHNYIGTEHLLLGLVREGDGVAARVLANMGVQLQKVRAAVEFIIGRGERPPQGEIRLTEAARRAIEAAFDAARELQQRYIGTEHLLLGVLAQGEEGGGNVLTALGVDLQRVREQVLQVIQDNASTNAPSPTPPAPTTVRQVVQELRAVLQLKYEAILREDYLRAEQLATRERGMWETLMGWEEQGTQRSLTYPLPESRWRFAPPTGDADTSQSRTDVPDYDPRTERFDKFTQRARKVLSLAHEEAARFNHNYIGTEHLLLGLVREGDGVAAHVLTRLGVDLARVRSQVEFIIGRGQRPPRGEMGVTPRARRVIQLAFDEARRTHHRYVGTEHLLLGLVREGEGIAAGVLESQGITLEAVRTEIRRVIDEGSSPT